MRLLNSGEKARVAEAVRKAELKTGGEIVTAVISESDDYMIHELLFSFLAGALGFLVATFGSEWLMLFLDSLFWTDSAVLLPLTVGLIAAAVTSIAYMLAQIPFLDRLIIGKRRMESVVHRRAVSYFFEAGVHETVDRTGVLLFISLLERRVVLVADKGINERVTPETWDRIVTALIKGVREGRLVESLERAVSDAGKVLEEHVPRRDDDTDELSNEPVNLDGKGGE